MFLFSYAISDAHIHSNERRSLRKFHPQFRYAEMNSHVARLMAMIEMLFILLHIPRTFSRFSRRVGLERCTGGNGIPAGAGALSSGLCREPPRKLPGQQFVARRTGEKRNRRRRGLRQARETLDRFGSGGLGVIEGPLGLAQDHHRGAAMADCDAKAS